MDCGNTNYSTKFSEYFFFLGNHTEGFTNVNIKTYPPLIVKKKYIYLEKRIRYYKKLYRIKNMIYVPEIKVLYYH